MANRPGPGISRFIEKETTDYETILRIWTFFPRKFDPIGSLDENVGVRDLGARSNVSIASSIVVIS
jgi:hypothetical protein